MTNLLSIQNNQKLLKLIQRKQYPELDALLWDVHTDSVTAEQAFKTYEKRWRYIDKSMLSQPEKDLINELTKQIGKGLFLPH